MARNFIKYNILRILPEKLEQTIDFYKTVCGMTYNIQPLNIDNCTYTSTDKHVHLFTYPVKDASYPPTGVGFLLDPNHKNSYGNSGYWKIGLALRDVNGAVHHLRLQGVQVGDGQQFYDVGFLTSLNDPNGHNIELLQQDFEENFSRPVNDGGLLSQPVDNPPAIGQITIRCTDPVRTRKFYEKVLSMKLVCTEQPANKLPFTLYFFAYTDDTPPSSNLSDIVNREWLYKKPYCQIEIQHRHNLPQGYQLVTNDDNPNNVRLGHVGFCISVSSDLMSRVKGFAGVKVCQDSEGKAVCFVKDPDGYVIQVVGGVL